MRERVTNVVCLDENEAGGCSPSCTRCLNQLLGRVGELGQYGTKKWRTALWLPAAYCTCGKQSTRRFDCLAFTAA